MPFEPHRLCFVLFMKTSGTVVRGGENKKILKAQLKHKFGVMEYELKVPESRHTSCQRERKAQVGRHPEFRRKTFLIKCRRWQRGVAWIWLPTRTKKITTHRTSRPRDVQTVWLIISRPLPKEKQTEKPFAIEATPCPPHLSTPPPSSNCNATPRAHGCRVRRRSDEKEKSRQAVRHGKWATI